MVKWGITVICHIFYILIIQILKLELLFVVLLFRVMFYLMSFLIVRNFIFNFLLFSIKRILIWLSLILLFVIIFYLSLLLIMLLWDKVLSSILVLSSQFLCILLRPYNVLSSLFMRIIICFIFLLIWALHNFRSFVLLGISIRLKASFFIQEIFPFFIDSISWRLLYMLNFR